MVNERFRTEKIIDSSFRLHRSGGDKDFKECLKSLEDISHALILPPEEYFCLHNQEGNNLVADVVRLDPLKFSAIAVVNPWLAEGGVEMLVKAFENGFKGLYLHPPRQGFKLSETITAPLIEVCRNYNKPVHCHTGTPVAAMPFQLAELARTFPRVNFVMGHAGWSDFWYDVIPAARQAANIFVEISSTTASEVKRFIEALGSKRLLFGSGTPVSSVVVELAKIERLRLPDNVLCDIMFKNAIEIYDL